MPKAAFEVFPQSTITFLQQLEQNNNREWFAQHKQEYIDNVQVPSLAFIEAMAARLKGISPNIVFDTRTNGSGSLMRIYRDVRFSPDKTPFNTNLGIVFWEGEGRKNENPGFYFDVETRGVGFYAGMYGFNKEMLEAFRSAVLDEEMGAELETALQSVRSAGYQVGGEHFKRVPRGFDPDHPRAHLLLYNTLYAWIMEPDPFLITRPGLLDLAFNHWQKMAPIHRWLVKLTCFSPL